MLAFCVLIISLKHICSAAKVEVMIGQRGKLVDFNDRLKCDSWEIEGGTVAMPLNVTDKSEGAYKCSSGEDVILLLAYENLELALTPEDGLVIGDNVTLSCLLTSFLSKITINNTVAIYEQNVVVEQSEHQEEIAEMNRIYTLCTPRFTITEAGPKAYVCIWSYFVQYKGVNYTGSMNVNLSTRVYLPARNALPDKTEVKVHEEIKCEADGDPPPQIFSWQCTASQEKDVAGDWETKNRLLIIRNPKDYNCICVASNFINIRAYHSVWNGTITVLAGYFQSNRPSITISVVSTILASYASLRSNVILTRLTLS